MSKRSVVEVNERVFEHAHEQRSTTSLDRAIVLPNYFPINRRNTLKKKGKILP
jgi:hypothetical protein